MAKKNAHRNMRKTRSARNLEESPQMNDDMSSDTEELSSRSSRRSKSSRGGQKHMASALSSAVGDRDYKEILRELVTSPAVKYVAGGIATAVLTRLANNMSIRYPEISNFIKENLDNFEGRLGEFRDGLDGDSASRQH